MMSYNCWMDVRGRNLEPLLLLLLCFVLTFGGLPKRQEQPGVSLLGREVEEKGCGAERREERKENRLSLLFVCLFVCAMMGGVTTEMVDFDTMDPYFDGVGQ